MISIIDKNKIIVMHGKGISNRQIARELGVSKNTVNSYIQEYKAYNYQLSHETDKAKIAIIQDLMCSKPAKKKYIKGRAAFNKEIEKRFHELLQIDQERDVALGSNKQSVTAALIHRVLISEGFKIGETTIRNEFRKHKDKPKECFIIQEYEYGQRAEYDFHQIKLLIGDKIRVFHQATITLPKSNIVFGKLYDNEKMEVFIESLVSFFAFCGGVVGTIVFDNMKTAVKRFLYGRQREYTDELIKISNYYGFKIQTTNGYSPNEKGHVENSGKEIRRGLFSLRYKFDDLNDLLVYYERELDKRNQAYYSEFMIERSHLRKLPNKHYEIGRMIQCKVNSYSLVSIDANFYSVPDKFVGKMVNCNVYITHIVIYDDHSNVIAKHQKKEGKQNYSIDFLHYIETFRRKPGAIENSIALKQAPAVLQTFFKKYFITDPQKFLEIITKMSLEDVIDLAVEFGYCKRHNLRVNPKYLGYDKNYTIEEISKRQLDEIANTFN